MHAERYPQGPALPQLAAGLVDRPGLCWLDGGRRPAGAAEGWGRGQISFLGSDPDATITRDGSHPAPLSALSELTTPGSCDAQLPAGAPLAGEVPCWAGFIAYDAHFPYTTGQPLSAGPAVLCFQRYDAWLAVDHDSGERWLVGDDADSCRRLAQRLELAATSASHPQASVTERRSSPGRPHRDAIEQALRHIADGDIYQVNLARHYDARLRGQPLALALCMRQQGEVPFGFFFDDGQRHIIGRSMERFLRWDRTAGTVECSPIKGTLARQGGRDDIEAASLRADTKEQAEHAMIVDLMRNDLGRIARTGSVRVTDLMRVQAYARLSHLVSTVACQARSGLTLAQLLEATFPPGSVTGAPKLRALQIIKALEPVPRGVYTGSYGFVDRLGGCNLSVAIRTAVIDDGAVRYHAGGGIVEASDPQRELAETELKAESFVAALQELEEQGKQAQRADPEHDRAKPPNLSNRQAM